MNQNSLMKFTSVIIFCLMAFVLTTGQSDITSAAATEPSTNQLNRELDAHGPSAENALDCTANPFTGVIELGGEKEVFIAYPTQTAPGPSLDLLKFDYPFDEPDNKTTVDTGWLRKDNEDSGALTAADLNADGDSEIVQVFRGASGWMQVAAYNQDPTQPFANDDVLDGWAGTNNIYVNHSDFNIAAGDLAQDNPGDQEIIIASLASDGKLHITMLNGTASGGISTGDNSVVGYWRTADAEFDPDPEFGANLALDIGNIDGIHDHDEIVVGHINDDNQLELLILAYDFSHQPGDGLRFAIKKIGGVEFNPQGTPRDLRLVVADIDGDLQDEIVVAIGRDSNDSNDSTSIGFYVFDAKRADGTNSSDIVLTERTQWNYGGDRTSFVDIDMVADDVDADGKAEVVFSFFGERRTTNEGGGLAVELFDAEAQNQPFARHASWYNGDGLLQGNSNPAVQIATGDLNKDGQADIAVVLRNRDDNLHLLNFTSSKLANDFDPDTDIELDDQGGGRLSSYNYGFISVESLPQLDKPLGSSKNEPQIAIGDWDKDSLLAEYDASDTNSVSCVTVIEPIVKSAVFVPPYWQNIYSQDGSEASPSTGSIGESVSAEASSENSMTTFSSHSGNVYVGAGVDTPVADISLKVRYGWQSRTATTDAVTNSQGQQQQTAWSNTSDFAVVHNSEYDCYQYALKEAGQELDGVVRLCEFQKLTEEAPNLDTWDRLNSPLADQHQDQWVPLVRDWTNLALFKEAKTSQSSTHEDWSADRAVDNNLDGNQSADSMTHTIRDADSQPWWQIDLGAVEEIGKVRIWNRTELDCFDTHADGVCAKRLHDFYLFISETDFADLPSDVDSLKSDARVHSFSFSGEALRQTTIQTMLDGKEVSGRYVRIQLDVPGTLTLAEVQIFGPNHTEPDRYPRAVRDLDKNDDYFEVELFNRELDPPAWEWVRVPGTISWDGAKNISAGTPPVLSEKTIGPGEGTLTWGLSQYQNASNSRGDTSSSSSSIGVELDAEAGFVGKVQAGGGYEHSWGLETATSHTTTLGQSFEIGGSVTGFPNGVDHVECKYSMIPYYYWVSTKSDSDFEHRYLVVDYVVPDTLDRTIDLSECRKDRSETNNPNISPTANAQTVTTGKGEAKAITLTGSDPDNGDTLSYIISSQPSNGTLSGTAPNVIYTPNAGFVGNDSFTFKVNDGLVDSAVETVSIVVTAGPGNPTETPAQIYLPIVTR